MLIHPHLTFVLYDKVVGEVVSPDTDILLVDEADIVVGEGDLVQAEQAEDQGCKDEEQTDSPFLYNHHLKLFLHNSMQCNGFSQDYIRPEVYSSRSEHLPEAPTCIRPRVHWTLSMFLNDQREPRESSERVQRKSGESPEQV